MFVASTRLSLPVSLYGRQTARRSWQAIRLYSNGYGDSGEWNPFNIINDPDIKRL